jgi:hypothetical protein
MTRTRARHKIQRPLSLLKAIEIDVAVKEAEMVRDYTNKGGLQKSPPMLSGGISIKSSSFYFFGK